MTSVLSMLLQTISCESTGVERLQIGRDRHLKSMLVVLFGSSKVPALAVDDANIVEGRRIRWARCDGAPVVLEALLQPPAQLQLGACM